jgi:23S rRNA (uracil1939-C5)-methyltransferase
MSAQTLDIIRLGGQGDGIAETPDGQVFVPFTLPGDVISAAVDKGRGTLDGGASSPRRTGSPRPARISDRTATMLNAAAARCSTWRMQAYRDWKRGLVVSALESRGIKAEVGELAGRRTAHARRRVVFAARRTETGAVLGFNKAQSHQIVPVESCVVATARINAATAGAQAHGGSRRRRQGGVQAHVLSTRCRASTSRRRRRSGSPKPTGSGSSPSRARSRHRAAELQWRIPDRESSRRSWVRRCRGQPAAGRLCAGQRGRRGADGRSGHRASEKGQAGGGSVFRLGHVYAPARSPTAMYMRWRATAALAALDKAARHAQGIKPVSVERRDLFRRPLMFSELKTYQGLAFDPPRAGAEAQAREIAKLREPAHRRRLLQPGDAGPRSRNPDCGRLPDQCRSHPIDQFLWSSHVEVVALLERPRR